VAVAEIGFKTFVINVGSGQSPPPLYCYSIYHTRSSLPIADDGTYHMNYMLLFGGTR
jgi:hypothetical protein